MNSDQNSKITLWLKSVLEKENLSNFTYEVTGKSTQGDGYMGDIVFVKTLGKTPENQPKEYNLVLKCSKRSETLREAIPVKDTFENEIYIYDKVVPAFTKFQKDRGLDEVFDSVPKLYGTFVGPSMEVIALGDLRASGYYLYDRKRPLTLDHVMLVVGEYGKLHAISAAMQDQQPEEFGKLANGVRDILKTFGQKMDLDKLFGAPVEDTCELIKDDVGGCILEKLKSFKGQVVYIIRELLSKPGHFSAITHGDCWNNNFMFKNEQPESDKPTKVAMLDWQISRFSSPVLDLSYFLYSCISQEDLKKFDDILKCYYESFSSYVRQLGSDPEKIFTYSQLLEDWKMFGKFGFMMALLVIKIAISEQDEVGNIVETVEKGLDAGETFLYEVKDKNKLKNRVLCIVKHVVERNFI